MSDSNIMVFRSGMVHTQGTFSTVLVHLVKTELNSSSLGQHRI